MKKQSSERRKDSCTVTQQIRAEGETKLTPENRPSRVPAWNRGAVAFQEPAAHKNCTIFKVDHIWGKAIVSTADTSSAVSQPSFQEPSPSPAQEAPGLTSPSCHPAEDGASCAASSKSKHSTSPGEARSSGTGTQPHAKRNSALCKQRPSPCS